MTTLLIIVGSWLAISATSLTVAVLHHRRMERFRRHADQSIDLTGGAR